MSQIGRKEIVIPEKVSVNIERVPITAKGPLGELSLNFKDGINITIKDDSLIVARKDDSVIKQRAAWTNKSSSF